MLQLPGWLVDVTLTCCCMTISTSMMVRREVCADGVERVVCRHLSTKMHRLSAVTVTSSLERFLLSGAQLCTQRVYLQIREMTLAQQVRHLRGVPRRSPCPLQQEKSKRIAFNSNQFH